MGVRFELRILFEFVFVQRNLYLYTQDLTLVGEPLESYGNTTILLNTPTLPNLGQFTIGKLLKRVQT